MIFWAAVEQIQLNINPTKKDTQSSYICIFYGRILKAQVCSHTISEDSVDIEAVRRTGFIVRATPHIRAELSGPGIIDDSGVGAADFI